MRIVDDVRGVVCSPANPDAARLLASNPKDYKKRVRRLAEKSVEST